MNRWFRFYSAAMRDPKVLRLSDKHFRLWISLLSVASENGGDIPEIDALKHLLAMRYDHLKQGLSHLASVSLIDVLGDGYRPHNWDKYQYKSDTSNERVAKHRAKRNVTVTPPDTDTDTEEDTSVSSTPLPPAERGALERASKPDFTLPDWVPEAEWLGFCEMRRRVRAPLTDRAKAGIIRELHKLQLAGHPPGRVLDQSTTNAWRGVFELKDGTHDRNLGRDHGAQFGQRRNPALDMLRDAMGE